MYRIAKIMARLLPLMDLSILLLGMFVVFMTFAKFSEQKDLSEKKLEKETVKSFVETSNKGKFTIECVFAACPGDPSRFQSGECYEVTGDFRRGEKVRDERIRKIIENNKPRRTIICLLTSAGAWDQDWTDEKVQLLKKKWGEESERLDIVRILNINFVD